jgi:hypothetical protein
MQIMLFPRLQNKDTFIKPRSDDYASGLGIGRVAVRELRFLL